MALAKRIIPCLDVDNGRVMKGVNFVGLRDAGNPVDVAQRYNDEGADELTFLDITASSSNRDTILHVIEAVSYTHWTRWIGRAKCSGAARAKSF